MQCRVWNAPLRQIERRQLAVALVWNSCYMLYGNERQRGVATCISRPYYHDRCTFVNLVHDTHLRTKLGLLMLIDVISVNPETVRQSPATGCAITKNVQSSLEISCHRKLLPVTKYTIRSPGWQAFELTPMLASWSWISPCIRERIVERVIREADFMQRT